MVGKNQLITPIEIHPPVSLNLLCAFSVYLLNFMYIDCNLVCIFWYFTT